MDSNICDYGFPVIVVFPIQVFSIPLLEITLLVLAKPLVSSYM